MIRGSVTGRKTQYGIGGTSQDLLPDDCRRVLEEAPVVAGIVVGVGSSFTRTPVVPVLPDVYGRTDGLVSSRIEGVSISSSHRLTVFSKLTTTELPELPVIRRARLLLGQGA